MGISGGSPTRTGDFPGRKRISSKTSKTHFDSQPPGEPGERYFGRRSSRALGPAQAHRLAERLPQLAIDTHSPAPASAGGLFNVPVAAVHLEIGCGGGEHLVHNARSHPGIGFIGAELYRNGLARTIAALDDHGCGNVRLFDAEAEALLDWLPQASLSVIDLLYPDPWRKRRHWKRRFVQSRNLDRIHRVLRAGGQFRFATDWEDYGNWTLNQVWSHGGLAWTARQAADWRQPWANWPGTRYEAKALREGRSPLYLRFEKPRAPNDSGDSGDPGDPGDSGDPGDPGDSGDPGTGTA